MIIYKSFHNINVLNGTLIKKSMPEDFDSFVNTYIAFAIRNGNNKEYNVVDRNSTVIHCISSIAAGTINCPDVSVDDIMDLDGFSHSIATKLLCEEQQVQTRIAAMGKQIKLGSLIQSLIKTDNGEYMYIIAKVEHSEWYDGESLRKNLGFPSEKKNVWKSAVFPMVVHDDISFDTVRVYTDNEAKYWAQQFLELSEKRNDETNTSAALEAIEIELKRRVRKQSERDYYHLKNTFITTFKTPQLINYTDMIEAIVGQYQPDDPSLDTQALKHILLTLPEKKQFDRQFMAIPDAVKKRKRLKFPVTNAIELSIEEGNSNYRDYVRAVELDGGKRCLQIECHCPETYNLFV